MRQDETVWTFSADLGDWLTVKLISQLLVLRQQVTSERSLAVKETVKLPYLT